MPLFKAIVKNDKSNTTVLDFVPPKIDGRTPDAAIRYLERSLNGSEFHMADVIKASTGIKDIELANLETRVETMVLERLKEVQEPAYKEAYQLGLDEGHKAAFEKSSGEIANRLSQVDTLLESLTQLKSQMVAQNEAHIIKLLFSVAKKIAFKEVSQDNESVMNIIRNAVGISQGEEQIVIEVAAEQLEFLESVKKETKRDLEALKNVKFEASPDVKPGGCVVKTNYGEIDARIEERVDKLWSSLAEVIPKVEDRIKSA